MKFYGNGLVWDSEKNIMLIRFDNGSYETNDDRILESLKKLNYKCEVEEEQKKTVKQSKK